MHQKSTHVQDGLTDTSFGDAHDDLDTRSSTKLLKVHFSFEEHSLLKRIDIEREHMENLTEGRLPVLYTSFDRLRACATFVLEKQTLIQQGKQPEQPEQPEKRSLSRPNYLDNSCVENTPSGRNSPAPPSSPTSTSIGIGAWIANVVSQKVHSPLIVPSLVNVNDLEATVSTTDRQERIPSRGTFYAESVTSGTRTLSSGKRTSDVAGGNSRQRVDSPHETVKASKAQQITYYAASTIVSSDDVSIDHRITSDQLSVAIEKRKRLTKKQRLSIDKHLRSVSRNTSIDVIEQMLWEGANPNVEDDEFGFLYIRAAFELSTDALQLLAEYGADITKTMTTTYHSALHAAVLGRQLDNLEYLINLGMPVDTPNADGETPLHLAVKTTGAYQMAKLLLESGADVNRDSNGDSNEDGTPFHLVMKTTRLDSRERSMMVELLLAHGAEGDFSVETTERRGKGLSVLGLI